MNFRLMTAKFAASVRERGVGATTRAIGRNLWHRLRAAPVDDFDRRHGTDTSGILPLWQMNACSPNARFGTRYQASAEGALMQIVDCLAIDPTEFTFIDLGCGKGRALLVAARLGFRSVVGVEIGSELTDVAKENLAKMDVTKATVIHGDAVEYVFPSGDLFVYLYNPFGDPVMRQVVCGLEHRIEQGGVGEVYVAYVRPACGELFDRSPFLCRVEAAGELYDVAIWKGSFANSFSRWSQ